MILLFWPWLLVIFISFVCGLFINKKRIKQLCIIVLILAIISSLYLVPLSTFGFDVTLPAISVFSIDFLRGFLIVVPIITLFGIACGLLGLTIKVIVLKIIKK